MRCQLGGVAHQNLGVQAHGHKHRTQLQVMLGQCAVGREDAGGFACFQDAGYGVFNGRLYCGVRCVAEELPGP